MDLLDGFEGILSISEGFWVSRGFQGSLGELKERVERFQDVLMRSNGFHAALEGLQRTSEGVFLVI